jgi:hypothetical protein
MRRPLPPVRPCADWTWLGAVGSFFRLSDLNTVWRQGGGDERNRGRISPSLRVLPLEVLLKQTMSGEVCAHTRRALR